MFFYDFKCIRCINDTPVYVGQPELFRTDSVNNPKSVKMDILRRWSDLYIQEWIAKANVHQTENNVYYLKKHNYLINVSKFNYSKIIKTSAPS